VEDEDYYTDRVPGEVFYKDEPKENWSLLIFCFIIWVRSKGLLYLFY
jgi:hypothetical protein